MKILPGFEIEENFISIKMTPPTINKHIEKLIKKLGATHEPDYIDVEPEPGAEVGDCFPAVQKKIASDGGKMIMGWQIWQSKNIVEAECHAVWEDPEGEIHDITPKSIGINRILFVEDADMVYKERQVDNIRMNITNNKLVDDLIGVSQAIHRFDNKGERADLYDLSDVLTEKEIKHREYLLELKERINAILSQNGNRDSLCPCGSSSKFRDCHGKDLAKRIAKEV